MGRLATDDTLNKVVDAIKNSETVQAQKEEIQAEGARVLATIPQDYKNTVEEVSSLKGDLVTTNTLLTSIGTIVHSENIDTAKSVTVMFDSAINKGVTIWICNTSTTDFDNNKTMSVNLIQRDGSEKNLGIIAKGGAFNVTLEKDIVCLLYTSRCV